MNKIDLTDTTGLRASSLELYTYETDQVRVEVDSRSVYYYLNGEHCFTLLIEEYQEAHKVIKTGINFCKEEPEVKNAD